MKIKELMEVLTDDTKVLLFDDDGEQRGERDRESGRILDTKFNNVEVSSISIDDGRLIVEAEAPTWRITGKVEVEVTVSVRAFTEDDAWDLVEYMDGSSLLDGYTSEVELEDAEYSDVDWEDITME